MMRPTIARFSPLDWLITVGLLCLIAFESAQILGLLSLGVGLWPTFLGSAILLGGILYLSSPAGRAVRLGGMEAVFLAGVASIILGGFLLMPFMDPPGAAMTLMVVLGFLIVAAGGYAMYRMDGAYRRAGALVPVEMPRAATAVSPAELGTVDIFRGLSPEGLAAVAALGRRVQMPSDTNLATAAEASGYVYAILDGQAEMHAASPIGEVTVRVAGPGESFPLAALVGSGQVITSARAMTDIDVVVMPSDKLRALCWDHPEIGRQIYMAISSILAERYRATLIRMTTGMQEALQRADFWANV